MVQCIAITFQYFIIIIFPMILCKIKKRIQEINRIGHIEGEVL